MPIDLALFRGGFMTDWHLLMAGSVTAMAAMLLIYVFAQRYIIKGITPTGLKT